MRVFPRRFGIDNPNDSGKDKYGGRTLKKESNHVTACTDRGSFVSPAVQAVCPATLQQGLTELFDSIARVMVAEDENKGDTAHIAKMTPIPVGDKMPFTNCPTLLL